MMILCTIGIFMGTVLGYFVGFVKHFTMKTGDPLKTVLLNMGIILRLNLGGGLRVLKRTVVLKKNTDSYES